MPWRKISLRETGSAWLRNSAVFIKRDGRRSQRAETSWGWQRQGKKPGGLWEETGSAAAHRRKCAEYSRTATEAVWLEQRAPPEEPSLRRETWGGRGDQSRVARRLSRALALTLTEVQNQWRVNALDDITQRFSMFFTDFSNVLATLINYEKVHYVRLPIAKYCWSHTELHLALPLWPGSRPEAGRTRKAEVPQGRGCLWGVGGGDPLSSVPAPEPFPLYSSKGDGWQSLHPPSQSWNPDSWEWIRRSPVSWSCAEGIKPSTSNFRCTSKKNSKGRKVFSTEPGKVLVRLTPDNLKESLSYFPSFTLLVNCCCPGSQSCPTLCNPMDCSVRFPCPSPSPGVCSNSYPLSLMMPSNHLILCLPLLPLPSILPSIRVFSNESALCIRWPKYCSHCSIRFKKFLLWVSHKEDAGPDSPALLSVRAPDLMTCGERAGVHLDEWKRRKAGKIDLRIIKLTAQFLFWGFKVNTLDLPLP